jgi:hypothetical protein
MGITKRITLYLHHNRELSDEVRSLLEDAMEAIEGYANERELAEARAEIAELSTAQWYWDDRDLEHAVPADELGAYDDAGDIIEVRPIHEMPAVFVLIREDGPYIFATQAEAEAARAAGGGE